MAIPTIRTAPIDDETALPNRVRKGRGSVSNRTSGRFDAAERYEIDDGWTQMEKHAFERRQTLLGIDTARRIITFNKSPDVGFDRSINPYKGCEHGCIFCFARPTHAYLDLSPGLDFETRIFRKPDAARLLRAELSDRRYKPAPLVLGINTDAYQPTERTEKLTRSLLEVLYEFRHPVSILTRSALIQRDLDILGPMAAMGLFRASLSITTLDRNLARVMEPRAATPQRRLDTLRALKAAGIPVGVMAARSFRD
ncbi:MAG: radical SAM protein [Asticcacaulis sp.]